MAIDSQMKRMSAMHVGCPWRGVAIDPGDASAQGKRQAAAYFYSGILADEPEPPDETVSIFIAGHRSHRRAMLLNDNRIYQFEGA